jgi:hypothetical protein
MFARFIMLAGIIFFSASALAQSTNEVWQHHIDSWGQRDVEALTGDYTENSILIINGEKFRGTSAIKNAFLQLFGIFDHGAQRIDPVVIDGRIVYITWHFTPTAKAEFFGTDTFVVEQGKIMIQTIASPLYDVFPVKP